MSEQQESTEATEGIETVGIVSDPITSQWDFIPAPFRDEMWEVIGSDVASNAFLPLELKVIQSSAAMVEGQDEDVAGRRDFSGLHQGQSAAGGLVSSKQLAQEYQRGFAEGHAKAAQEQQHLTTRLDQVLRTIESGREQLYKKIEQEALELSLRIAKHILAITAEVKPEYIVDVIKQGLKSLGAAKPLRIRLSADDYEFIHVVGLPAELSEHELGIQYVSDEAIRSGCVIETDFGETDLQLEHMLDQIKETLYEVSR